MPTNDPDSTEAPRAQRPLLQPRHEQTFPELTASEIGRMRRFGEVRHYADGALLFETGEPGPGMFVILSGHVAITQRDGLGHITPVIDQGPGQFLAELGQLSGRMALVDGHAEGEVEVLLIPPERLRALLVAEADLGERIYSQKLAGSWRWIYVVTAMISLYLNVFVLVIQSFLKIGPLHALAPSVPPSEPPFAIVQGIVLVFFAVMIYRAAKKFHAPAVITF